MSAYEPDAEYRCERDGAFLDPGEKGWVCRMCGLAPDSYVTARHLNQVAATWSGNGVGRITLEMGFETAFSLGFLVPRTDRWDL